MLRYSIGTKPQIPQHIFEQMGHYRREVFINRLGWALDTIEGMELDEFDGLDAVYVCSHDDDGVVNGVARLLPTMGPYLLEKVFPQLWSGHNLPRDPQIWELSRFATTDLNRKTSWPLTKSVSSEKAAPNLLLRVIETAQMHGAHTLITVTGVAMERLLRLNGFRCVRTGVPAMCLGTPIVGLRINFY
jgi:N-acyl-L-homoserine lactone synthetase